MGYARRQRAERSGGRWCKTAWNGSAPRPRPVTAAPGPCAVLAAEIKGAQFKISNLQSELRHGAGPDKPELVQEIAEAEEKLASLEQQKAALGCP